MDKIHSCVSPEGTFIYGIHKPSYRVENLRKQKHDALLGINETGEEVRNEQNFPDGNLRVNNADWIFEIRNPFPFRGATFIDKEWADGSAANLDKIRIPAPEKLSFSSLLKSHNIPPSFIVELPQPLRLSLATCSTDQNDLIAIAESCTTFIKDSSGTPIGLEYKKNHNGVYKAVIHDHLLFEAVANNPALPDEYKIVMVIRPGAQGGSEIVGDYQTEKTQVFEYLRRNSYIPGGHYAANMGDSAIRYSIEKLSTEDMTGLRNLYYQRTYIRLSEELNIKHDGNNPFSKDELESLRQMLIVECKKNTPKMTSTLWGWNFGFDYAPSRYRLHASHQQIHQQYAMLQDKVETFSADPFTPLGSAPTYGCGDLICDVIESYQRFCGKDFFPTYYRAIRENKRMDGDSSKESSLIIWEDENSILFVPKAQTSQWEVQLMTKPGSDGKTVGNIVEADTATRDSLDKGIFLAQKALHTLGAKMVTSIEYPKRINSTHDLCQPLIYCLLPRLPESPGAFSEAQLRYINGHYPEDFAHVCRQSLKKQELI